MKEVQGMSCFVAHLVLRYHFIYIIIMCCNITVYYLFVKGALVMLRSCLKVSLCMILPNSPWPHLAKSLVESSV